jgi:hypothetical protein
MKKYQKNPPLIFENIAAKFCGHPPRYGMRRFAVQPPVKIPTPYGGRLVWRLPGGTQIICHLKDKNKIRHKKRWSQCMYMYYFLGHQATVS